MEFAYMKNVIIIGTGGHAKVIADIVLCAGDRLVGFLTSDRDKKEFLGYPVLGQEADYCKFPDCSFIIADCGEVFADKRLEIVCGFCCCDLICCFLCGYR